MKRAGVMAAFAVLCGVLGLMVATALAIVDAANGPQPVPATVRPAHSPAELQELPGSAPSPEPVRIGGGGRAAAPDGQPAPQRTTRRYATNADLSTAELWLVWSAMGLYGLAVFLAVVIASQNHANLSVVTRLAQARRWRGCRR